MTYHDYVYIPDATYAEVEAFREILHKYALGMKMRQGENGAPLGGGPAGALYGITTGQRLRRPNGIPEGCWEI